MKYKKGQYILIKFDKSGSVKKTKTFKNYITTKQASDEYLKKHYDRSTVISRVLFNSIDDIQKWSYIKGTLI